MPHPDEPALVAYVAEHSSATALAVYDATDPAATGAALRAAAAEIAMIRHPDEPDAPLPNWCQVLDEDGVPVLHLVVVQGASMVAEVFSVRTAAARPPADRYAWLFVGLDEQQLTATRDACWRMLARW